MKEEPNPYVPPDDLIGNYLYWCWFTNDWEPYIPAPEVLPKLDDTKENTNLVC